MRRESRMCAAARSMTWSRLSGPWLPWEYVVLHLRRRSAPAPPQPHPGGARSATGVPAVIFTLGEKVASSGRTARCGQPVPRCPSGCSPPATWWPITRTRTPCSRSWIPRARPRARADQPRPRRSGAGTRDAVPAALRCAERKGAGGPRERGRSRLCGTSILATGRSVPRSIASRVLRIVETAAARCSSTTSTRAPSRPCRS